MRLSRGTQQHGAFWKFFFQLCVAFDCSSPAWLPMHTDVLPSAMVAISLQAHRAVFTLPVHAEALVLSLAVNIWRCVNENPAVLMHMVEEEEEAFEDTPIGKLLTNSFSWQRQFTAVTA